MQAIDEREIAKVVAHEQRTKNDLWDTEHADRETARGLIKRKLTELRLREQQKAGIQKTIATIDAEIERAVENHANEAAPIQKKLRALEQDIITALTSDGPVTILENQRTAARDNLEKLNLALQEKTSKLNDRRTLLETELNLPELGTSALGALEGRLANTAPPELHDMKHSIDCEIQWLERRRSHASARLFDHQNSLESTTQHFDDESRNILNRRVSRWQLELNRAGEALGDATRRKSEHYKKMLTV